MTVPIHNQTPKDNLLPIVIIKDPISWMKSMCRTSYGAFWNKRVADHCPAFGGTNTLTTKYSFGRRQQVKFSVEYASLVHLWNEWYRQYYDSHQPHMLVRFEDLLFHGPAVLSAISKCTGIRSTKPFEYLVQASKSHGKPTNDFVSAIIKYGDAVNRTQPMTEEDLQYVRDHIDTELLRVFQYTV